MYTSAVEVRMSVWGGAGGAGGAGGGGGGRCVSHGRKT